MSENILLAHGSGGILSHELITGVFVHHFNNLILDDLGDAAILGALPPGNLAMTTDSYVVSPLFFPGGDIGKLAVCGTINDLSVAGARPLYLSCGFILEEGLSVEVLERVVMSMAETAAAAGVRIVTGDTKVVERGAADGLFINTAGIGVVPADRVLGPKRLKPGDVLLINGSIGDHGMAVMLQREEFSFDSRIESDCAPLNGLIEELFQAVPAGIRCMRDATRGGLATLLNEWAEVGVGIEVDETAIPITDSVRAACEFLGLDAFYAANEGKVVVAVDRAMADIALEALRSHPLGSGASIIGRVNEEHPGRVVVRTPYGARRIISMLTGDQLPRIC